MSVEVFHGTWKIIECVNLSHAKNITPASIAGAIFVLQENGEVKWDIPVDVEKEFPLFHCDCYEVVQTFVGVCIQMGAVSGHMFEFWVDRPVPRDMMLLTFEGWCMIQCQQIIAIQPPLDFPYSFLSAFDEGYFSDFQLPLENNQDPNLSTTSIHTKFKVHSVILELSNSDPNEISKLPSDVLQVVLHFLYSQSLPSNLSMDIGRRCIELAPQSMTEFVKMCQDYVHRATLKQKIVQLVNEVHSCAEAMASAFKDRSVICPSRFCYVIKLALRDASVAFMKLVELCVLYGEEAPILNRNERLEILRYAKSRLPIFLTQFLSMLRNIKNDFSTVKPTDRNDIAAHVAPEIETLLDALSNLMKEAKDACNEIWTRWSLLNSDPIYSPYQEYCHDGNNPQTERNSKSQSQQQFETGSSNATISFTEALYSIFRKREVVKLHQVQGQVAAIHLYLAQKKENFEDMTTAVKVRCVSRNLEQLLEELPVFLLRLEEIMIAFDDRFQWKDFKFCLQLAISQVCQTIQHLRKEKNQLQKFFHSLSELVQRDEFHQSLINLGLFDLPTDASPSLEGCPDSGISSSTSSHSSGFGSDSVSSAQSQPMKPKQNEWHSHKSGIKTSKLRFRTDFETTELNLVENLCTPKKAKDNILAQNGSKILETKNHSDMIFELAQEEEKLEIPAHRVIVAARCDWFRRALLSGMKESIEKRIIIHDCPVHVFQLFLSFVYSGEITSDVSLETLSELIAFADRYELDMLKLYCEQELALRHLDETSVIFLLSMADQYNARTLRGATMEYIAGNPSIMGKEVFEELSPELQMEVYDTTMWSKPKKVFSIPDELLSCPRYMLVPDSPSEEDNSSSGSSSPAMGHRHTHRHHHSHTHTHSHVSASGMNVMNPFTDTSSTSYSVQRAIANSIAEQAKRNFPCGEAAAMPASHQHNEDYQTNEPNAKQFGSSSAGTESKRDEEGCDNIGLMSVGLENNSEALESCVSQLRDVLGDSETQEDLCRIAIAAGFDVNRALNLFFSSS